MPHHCCVIGCKNISNKNVTLSYYGIPKIPNRLNKRTDLAAKRRQLWLSRISRDSSSNPDHWKVCMKHFITGAPADLYDTNSPDWAPSLNLGHSKFTSVEVNAYTSLERCERATKRQKLASNIDAGTSLLQLQQQSPIESDGELQSKNPEVEGGTACHLKEEESSASESEGEGSATLLPKAVGVRLHLEGKTNSVVHPMDKESTVLHSDNENNTLLYPDGGVALHTKSCQRIDVSCQTDLQMSLINSLQEQLNKLIEEKVTLESKLNAKTLNEDFFKDKDEKVKFYTGLNRYCDLMNLFGLISYHITSTSRSSLTPFQQMLMTLMKLRHNYPMQDLADRFGASETTCGRIFRKILDVLYVRIKWLVRWPEREECKLTMPMCFREEFGNKVAIIIDCFEVFLDQPTNLLAHAKTWSLHKHHNTVKFLIGISPQGSVSFISKAWDGRTSDKYIAEHCGILDNILPVDIVMADRGFDIAESVALKQANLVIPSFMKGRRQLSMEDDASTRKIANVRIHVERLIGCVQQKFQILKGNIPLPYVTSCDDEGMTTLDKIAVVCCALTNICLSVVCFE